MRQVIVFALAASTAIPVASTAIPVASTAIPVASSFSWKIQAPPAQSTTERHLTNIRQLTSGGENAEAYFSPDGTRLIYQSTRPEYPCDQI